MKFPDGKFGFIHADPPWAYATRGNGNQVPARGDQPYSTMTLDELKALSVGDVAAPDALLLMWTISSHIDQALDLGRAWGFKYKSLGVIWCKTQKGDPATPKMGMGHWIRQDSEITLLFTKGSPKRLDAGVRQTIFEPAREHSRKPDAAYEACERLAAGPYLDLFGRCTRPGWTVWGNEATKFDKDALPALGTLEDAPHTPGRFIRTARRPKADLLA